MITATIIFLSSIILWAFHLVMTAPIIENELTGYYEPADNWYTKLLSTKFKFWSKNKKEV